MLGAPDKLNMTTLKPTNRVLKTSEPQQVHPLIAQTPEWETQI
jgi:hypothetical protein